MTTEAPEKTRIETLTEELEAAKEAVEKFDSENAEKIAAIQSVVPMDVDAFMALMEPRRILKAKLDKAESTLADARKNDQWESNAALRSPIEDAIRTVLIDNVPSAPAISASGTIDLSGEEEPVVTIKIVLAPVDTSALAELIGSSADAAKLREQGFKGLTFNVTNIGKPDALLKLAPSDGLPKAAASTSNGSSGERAGTIEYQYKGEWLGTKAFLLAVVADEGTDVSDTSKGLGRALYGDGNAMSNYGKSTAKRLGVESRTS